ncbi:hypothetical protein Tco_1475600 [Tanacetum coccineum]
MEDPYRGSTDEQNSAYRDLDRITCKETKNLWSFLEDLRHLPIKSRKLYFPSTIEKLFAKLPPSLSNKIEESFKAKYNGLNSGVLPAIKFTHTFVSEMCKDVALAKELRDLYLRSAIPIHDYYKNNRKKYGMRKSRTYKRKPHNSHVKPFKRMRKSRTYQELDLDDNWDIISADFDDSSVYSILEGEGDSEDENEDYQYSHHAFMFHPGPPIKIADMVQSIRSWKLNKELPAKSKVFNVKRKQPHKPKEEKDCSSNEVRLLKELLKEKTEHKKEELWLSERSLLVRDVTDALKIIDQLKTKQIRLEEQKDEEIRNLKAQPQEIKEEEIEVQFSKE